MSTKQKISTASRLSKQLQGLKKIRRKKIAQNRKSREKRKSLTKNQKNDVLAKTRGRCHICGGKVLDAKSWQADHVISYAQGGKHTIDNYLPAHAICNHYRRSYTSDEFQWILKLGVWLRTQIEQENSQAMELAERFVSHEIRRQARHRK